MRRHRLSTSKQIIQHNYDVILWEARALKKVKLTKAQFVKRFLQDQAIRRLINEVRRREGKEAKESKDQEGQDPNGGSDA